jgi:hypothetical protein
MRGETKMSGQQRARVFLSGYTTKNNQVRKRPFLDLIDAVLFVGYAVAGIIFTLIAFEIPKDVLSPYETGSIVILLFLCSLVCFVLSKLADMHRDIRRLKDGK